MHCKWNGNFILMPTVGTAIPSAYIGNTVDTTIILPIIGEKVVAIVDRNHPSYTSRIPAGGKYKMYHVLWYTKYTMLYIYSSTSHRFHFSLYRHTEVCALQPCPSLVTV